MRKRTVALAFLAFVAALVAASLLGLRTRWAGDRICALAAEKLGAATGLPMAFEACRVDPLALEIEARGVRLGPPEAPTFAAEVLAARLSAVQPLGRRLHLERIRLVRPRVAVQLGGAGGGGACPPPFLAQFEIRRLEVEDGAVDLALPGGGRISVPRIEVHALPSPRTLRDLAAPRSRIAVETGPVRAEARGQAIALDRLRGELDAAWDLSLVEIRSVEATAAEVRFGLRGSVRDLCAPRLDLVVTAEGSARALAALGGRPDARWEGAAALEVRAAGPVRAPDLSGSARFAGLRFGPFVAGDGRAAARLAGDRIMVDRLETAFRGGSASAHGVIRLTRGLPIEADVRVDRIDLAEILDRVGVKGAWISLRLDGQARIAGTLSPLRLEGALATDLADLRVLTHSWDTSTPVSTPVLELARGRVQTGVAIDRDGIAFEHARVAAGQGVLDADATIRFAHANGFHVQCAGDVDLGVLRHIASIPWSGRARVEVALGATPYGNPRIEGRARAEGFRFLDLDLGTAAADLSYRDFLLHLTGVEGIRGQTHYRGEMVIDLRPPTRIVSSRFTARGRLRDLFDGAIDWLPRTRLVREVMDGDVEVTATGSGRATAIDGEFDAQLGAGTLYGRPYDSGRIIGRIRQGVESSFERAELRRGAGSVRARGRWGFVFPFPWELEIGFAGVPVADLALPGDRWSGTASGTATLGGSTEHPLVRFAANGEAVTVHGVPLGTVQAGGTLADRKLAMTASAEGIRFSGEARLEARGPYRARAELDLDDAARLVPGGAPAGLKLRVAGTAEAEGEMGELAASRGLVTLDKLGISLGDLRVDAAGPVVLALSRGRLELSPAVLRGPTTELALAGARSSTGDLELSAEGTMDLRLLSGLVPALRRTQGQLVLDAHVGGTIEDPVVVGSGRLEDAGLQAKGAAVALSGVRGKLAFSQNRVLFDDLEGQLNGGRAVFRGEVELARLAPARLRVEAELDEVPVAIPSTLPATLQGRVEAEGTPDAILLTGRVHVLRARYTQNVELERRLLEFRRRQIAPPRPYDPSGEWLRLDVQVVVDGDARVDNDLVRGGVRGELTLSGTLSAPGVVGSLSMTEGSQAIFRGNEFHLSHAVVSFADRNRIDTALDVHGEAQVRDYQVFMHLFGSLSEPKLDLTSTPALSQPDLMTLLSLGFTTRDTAAGGGYQGVATAAALQALMSASGMDEQVRRFLPRDGVLRDFSVRMTSVYSETTGQVEPRAEFESWLLRDRLRLRFQAPVAGARGQRAQAEVRLGQHGAIQYQWDNENPDAVSGDHGVDLKLRWEWND